MSPEPVHPTEKCPTCKRPGLLRSRCRCIYYCIKCSEGHSWHTCPTHRVLVAGDVLYMDGRLCTCLPTKITTDV